MAQWIKELATKPYVQSLRPFPQEPHGRSGPTLGKLFSDLQN